MVTAVAVALVAAGCVAVAVRRRYVVVTVRGESMLPTFADGQRVLVRRCAVAAVAPGDVVVFADPRDADLQRLAAERERLVAAGIPALPPPSWRGGEWLVKRAVAVPGDPVPRAAVAALAEVDHEVVPAGALVVLGDNADHSDDSRRYGYVAADRLVGRVLRTLS
ncbi:S26 family signal peptidase [Luedemannella helvata]|uniref:signal peptidase I n=1 Tax=Luedemannella helvata TaxID=349315 RepID=A0ABN2KZP3_9ACTN